MEEIIYDPRKVIKYGELISKGGALIFPKDLPDIDKEKYSLVGIIVAAYRGVSTFGIELIDNEVYNAFKKQLGSLWFTFGGAWLFYKVKLKEKEKCLHIFEDNALISSTNPKRDGLEKLLEIADFKVNLEE